MTDPKNCSFCERNNPIAHSTEWVVPLPILRKKQNTPFSFYSGRLYLLIAWDEHLFYAKSSIREKYNIPELSKNTSFATLHGTGEGGNGISFMRDFYSVGRYQSDNMWFEKPLYKSTI